MEESTFRQMHSGNGDNVAGSKEVNNYIIIADIPKGKTDPVSEKNEYCKHAFMEYVSLPIIGIEKTLNIEKIYVTLVLAHENLTREKVLVDSSGVSFDNVIGSVDMQRDLGRPQRVEAGNTVSLRNVLSCKKAIILGDPGIGKSTLLKKVFIDICKGSSFPDYLPVYISLSDISIDNTNFIYDYVCQKYRNLKDAFDYYVEVGRIFFLIDGLDEIDYRKQKLVSSTINQMTVWGSKVFLTCRTTVFPRSLFASDFKIFECIGFNAAQRRKFLRVWFDNDLNLVSLIESEIVNNLGTVGISRNPLLLSLIAMQFEENRHFTLPQKRIQIYLKSIQSLLEKREIKNVWGISISARLELLKYIAFRMSMDNIDVINETQLRDIIKDWRKNEPDSIFNQYAIDIAMQLMTEVDGIIHRCSQNQFRFLHLVLQESLTAQYLAQQENWFEIFKAKMLLPRWEETLRLNISLVTKRKENKLLLIEYFNKEVDKESDCLFLVGRYVSDFHASDIQIFFPIFKNILLYVVGDRDQFDFNDAIVSLASICNSHAAYRDYLISFFTKELKESYRLLSTYITLLKLIPSDVTRREVERLLYIFESGHFKREISLSIIGRLINALEYYYNFGFWKEIYLKYVNEQNSYLSGIIAVALGNVQLDEMCSFLERETYKKNTYINCLIYYILQTYEDEETNERFFRMAIEDCNICLEQTFTDKYQMVSDTILKMIKEERNEISQAILLNSGFLLTKPEDYVFLENIFFNKNFSLILRCSALDAYLVANGNNRENMGKIIYFLRSSSIEKELQMVCTNNLANMENSLLSRYFFDCGTKLDDRVIQSLVRLLSTIVIDDAVPWLKEVLDKFKVGTSIHMYATLALAKQGYQGILGTIDYLEGYMAQYHNMHLREKILLIKAFSMSNEKRGTEWLVHLLMSETDIDIASLIIENMGYIREKEIENALLRYLDVERWPQAWPLPLPEREGGEQRPTDRRMLMIILSIGRLGVCKAIPLLQKIYKDESQTDEVRQAAYITYKNLKWDSNLEALISS